MRKIKAGAIQPDYLPVPGKYDCLSDGYVADAGEIVQNYVKKQLELSFDLIDRAGREGCGIVTTSEDASGLGAFLVDPAERKVFPELAALSAPLAEEGFSKLARAHGMYVLACYFKPADGAIYNTANLFGRKGEFLWEYRKTHLPAYEKWQVAEGDILGAYDTDFGRIGACICYDMMFPECVEAVALAGAEIIFHPTAGYGWYDAIGEATLRVRANDNSVYIVTAKNCVQYAGFAGKSGVIDPWGQPLADAGFQRNAVVSREIDLDEPKTQPAWYYPVPTSGIPNMRERALSERRPELYGALCAKTRERLCAPGRERQLEIIELIKSGRCRW
jgi:omega-amidase